LRQDFKELILPHIDAAYNLARYLSRDAAAADDIVQEACLRALRAFGGYRGGDPKSWLLAIVRNCSFNWIKANRADGAFHPPTRDYADGVEEWGGESLGSPEADLMREADIDTVRRLIEELPEPFRETLVLRELEELSYKQIAEITAVAVGTVMSRLARARQMLSRGLRREAKLEQGT
jgi:RNA polymerase sigma-70 factor (ECF subfamily)